MPVHDGDRKRVASGRFGLPSSSSSTASSASSSRDGDPVQFLALLQDYAAGNSQTERALQNLKPRNIEIQAAVEKETSELISKKTSQRRAEEEREGVSAELASVRAVMSAKKVRVLLLQNKIATGTAEDERLSEEEQKIRDSFIKDMMGLNDNIRNLQERNATNQLQEQVRMKREELDNMQERLRELQSRRISSRKLRSNVTAPPGSSDHGAAVADEDAKLQADLAESEALAVADVAGELLVLREALNEKTKEYQTAKEKYEMLQVKKGKEEERWSLITSVMNAMRAVQEMSEKNAQLDEWNMTLQENMRNVYTCDKCGHDNLATSFSTTPTAP